MTGSRSFQFFARSSDGKAIFGFDTLEGATTAALEYGEGAFVIDTAARTYNPMLHAVRNGELKITGFGGWGADRMGLDRDYIESIKKGHVAIVHAFLAKGANVNAKDAKGGPALHWAVGGGKLAIVELLLAHGVDVSVVDGNGQTAAELAQKRGRSEICKLLAPNE